MNPEQDSGSLADRAAAWIPPWERPAHRESADDQRREDVGADPDALDDADALDREIDADIVRQAGLPGPGTVESDVEGEIDFATETAAETVAVADTDTDTDTAADADADADNGVESDRLSDPVAGAEPDLTADVGTDAGTGVDAGAVSSAEGNALTDVAAAVETNAVGMSATGAEGDWATNAEADVEAGRQPDVEAGSEPDAAAGPEPDKEPDPDTLLAAGPSPLPGLAGAELGGALEAILMVVDEPVTEAQLADVLDVAPEDVAERLRALAADYAESGRGFELRRAAGGWRFYTRAEFSGYVERFVLDGQSARLTQAALETLAVVAYQQPVTRSRISAIRGVNCDGVVRTLVTRGLLEESGTQPDTGAYLYRTTTLFLEKLGLDSVDELPPLAPFLPDDVNGLTDAQR